MESRQLFMSLGTNCEAAYHVRRYFAFETAFPFDWWITPVRLVSGLTLSGFRGRVQLRASSHAGDQRQNRKRAPGRDLLIATNLSSETWVHPPLLNFVRRFAKEKVILPLAERGDRDFAKIGVQLPGGIDPRHARFTSGERCLSLRKQSSVTRII
jgi:hypothetical protein